MNEPAAQFAQADCPVDAANVPGPQFVQLVAPGLALTVPAAQSLHTDWPAVDANDPGSQLMQAVCPGWF